MKNEYIDELFNDVMGGSDTSSAMIEVLPMADGTNMEEFLFETDPSCPDIIPILPMTGNVLFPGTITPINIARDMSLRLLRKVAGSGEYIGVVTQRNDYSDIPARSDLYDIGCLAQVVKVIDMPNSDVIAILRGSCCFRLGEIVSVKPFLMGEKQAAATADLIETFSKEDRESVKILSRRYISYLKSANPSDITIKTLKEIRGPRMLVNFIASHIDIDVASKQKLLEAPTFADRIVALIRHIQGLSAMEDLRHEIQEKTRVSMDKQQREYFLNQQMHIIQEELGGASNEAEVAHLRERASKMLWSDEVAEHFNHEMDKLLRTNSASPDYSVQLNYLNLMLDLPWNYRGSFNTDMHKARKRLDSNHFGLEKVKERILEMMAVLNLTEQRKSPVLCLVGAPGTGKTSLGKSIASALGRNYVRVALGGVHDEAEIRGHRRTYVGSMPGRIISGMIKAGVSNPVFVLDEIDKVQTNNFSGDPMAALLEVLDPEQNLAFHDNYLDIDYDLSNVLFIATANSTAGIHPALLDRMEIIEVPGYIMEEKLQIAKQYLVPRQLTENGFKRNSFTFTAEVLRKMIEDYTRESGVRQLEKTIAKVIRNRAVKVASGEEAPKRIGINELRPVLGLPLHQDERRVDEPRVAVVTGLAWTQVGGTILFIEACTSKGKGTLTMTGNLGDVMKESATRAFEYIKANATSLNIDDEKLENSNIHIHVPEGATPKDGPSAGITIFTAMVSAFTGRKVRADFAMTGEITLRGAVTPVGGIREKILAAKRAGITDIVLCNDNRRDVEDITQQYLAGLTFHYITDMSQVLPLVLI
ncbi:MAG: endopeptidase La [Bacteroidales bacterium]|nr:endopeptidase La [Bacteroidales bacterium]